MAHKTSISKLTFSEQSCVHLISVRSNAYQEDFKGDFVSILKWELVKEGFIARRTWGKGKQRRFGPGLKQTKLSSIQSKAWST